MSEFGGLWKHENNHMHLYPRRQNVAAQVAEELITVTYATPMEERRKKEGKKEEMSDFAVGGLAGSTGVLEDPGGGDSRPGAGNLCSVLVK